MLQAVDCISVNRDVSEESCVKDRRNKKDIKLGKGFWENRADEVTTNKGKGQKKNQQMNINVTHLRLRNRAPRPEVWTRVQFCIQ